MNIFKIKLYIIKMSFEKQLVCPTLEEIDLIRKKLNSIVDIPYNKEIKSQKNFFNNYLIIKYTI